MKKSNFAVLQERFFIFKHFASVLVLSKGSLSSNDSNVNENVTWK